MEKQYRLNVFGHPELTAPDGERIEFNTRRQAGILTYLTLKIRGHPVRRDLLVELFWPDVEEDRGRHSFSQAISDLRKKLGKKAIILRDGAVTLTTRIATELDRKGESAPDLKTLGEPLLGMEDLGGVSLSHWLDVARAALNERLRSCRQGDLSEQRASGDMEALRENAERIYRADPLNDEAVLALAEDLLLKGDETGAKSTLRAHVRRIKGACGGDPSPEIRALLARLATRKPKPKKLIQPVVNMVGRDNEMASVESLWSSIREGGSVSVLIAGQPGLGKTTLIEKFVDSVRARKWPCYYIQCHEMGRRIPYSAISALIGLLVEEPGVSGTDPALLAEASRVAPQLKTAYPGIPIPPPADPDSYRLKVAGALFGMMQEITDGSPLLIAFDDIHNMDQASKDTVYVLYHRMRAQSAMFLCSARSPDDGKVVSRSDIMPWQSTLMLSPLNGESSRALLCGISQDLDPSLAERVLKMGQGNPHMIEILVNDLRENGDDAIVSLKGPKSEWSWRASGTMNRALAGLLFGLTANSQRLLDLIAVVERQITIAEAVRVLSIDEKAANAAALELLERGLVRFDGDALAMKNELHKIYVRSRMNPDIRRFMHARLAKEVAEDHPNCFDTTLEQAHHLLGAESITEAVEKVLGGARRALDRGAPREAETAIMAAGKAVSVGGNHELSFLLGKSLAQQGDFRSAASILEATLKSEYGATGELLRLLSESLLRSGVTEGRVLTLAHKALRDATERVDDLEVASTLQLLTEIAFALGNDELTESAARYANEFAVGSTQPEVRGKARLTVGFFRLVIGQYEDAISELEAAETELRSLQPDASYRRALNGLGICYTGTGDFERAERALLKAIAVSDQIGDAAGSTNSRSNLGSLFLDQGRYPEAQDCFRLSMKAAKNATTPGSYARCCTNVGTLSIILGHQDTAQEHLIMAEDSAAKAGSWRDRVMVLLERTDFNIYIGNDGAAWQTMEEVSELMKLHPSSMGAETGHFSRLLRHQAYATSGWEALQAIVSRDPASDHGRLPNRLELQMFEAWAKIDAGIVGGLEEGRKIVSQAIRVGLLGLVSKIHALHCLPVTIEPIAGVSSGMLIAKIYEDQGGDPGLA